MQVVKAHSGEDIVVDTSPEATAVFGFQTGVKVRFTKGRHNQRQALILGVCDGSLWFQFLDEEGARTMSLRCREEYLRQCGWVDTSVE